MRQIRLNIKNRKGNMLSATLDLPIHQKASNYVLFAHCFTCSSNLNAVRNISRSLGTQGFGVLRFDFTGLGKSEGDFSDSHFAANINDLEDVYAYMADHYQAPNLIVGHSLGGAASIVAASRLDGVKAVATIGAPADIQHTTKHFSHQIEEIASKGDVQVNIGGRPFKINANFLTQFQSIELTEIVKSLKKPILVLHAPSDDIVAIDHAKKIYDHAFHPKSFVSLDQANHLLSNEKDSLYAGEVIGSWAKRYLTTSSSNNINTLGEQVVGHLDLIENKFTTTIQMAKHTLYADEPSSLGGEDLGPSPYELLNAGLAACTAMTLKLYANHKKWDLQQVYVYLTHAKKHIKNADSSLPLDNIEKKLRFVGELTQEQQNKLKEVASKCPVHKTLTSITRINTTVIS